MKCNTQNRPLTPEQEERQRKHNIRNNEQYLNYISRCLMLSVRNNAGIGACCGGCVAMASAGARNDDGITSRLFP